VSQPTPEEAVQAHVLALAVSATDAAPPGPLALADDGARVNVQGAAACVTV
jgi:hypothetical protein